MPGVQETHAHHVLTAGLIESTTYVLWASSGAADVVPVGLLMWCFGLYTQYRVCGEHAHQKLASPQAEHSGEVVAVSRFGGRSCDLRGVQRA